MKNRKVLPFIIGFFFILPLVLGDERVVNQEQCDAMNNLGVGAGNNHGTSFIFNASFSGAKFTNLQIWIANNSYSGGQFLEVRCCTGETVCGGTGNAFMQNYTLPSISTTATCGGATLYNLSLNWIPTQNGNYTCMARQTGASGALYMGQWSSASVYNNGKLLHNGAFFPAAENTFIIWQDNQNFTLTARDIYSGNAISVFNATVNGTHYTTSTGTIQTTIPKNTGLVNISVNANSYFVNESINYDTVSPSAEINLTRYLVISAKEDYLTTQYINNFTVSYQNSSGNYSVSTTTGAAYIPHYTGVWNITVYNANNNGVSYNSDTDTISLSNYLQNYTFNLTRSYYLELLFNDSRYWEVYEVSLGKIGKYGNGTNISVSLQSIPQGKVQARFRKHNESGFTQFYEFINHLGDIHQNITILTQNDTYVYFRVMDLGQSPLSNAYVQLWEGVANSTDWANFTLIGQRLTDSDGYAYFIRDSNKAYSVRVYKDGYEDYDQFADYAADNLDIAKANPINIYLTKTSNVFNWNSKLYAPEKYFTVSDNITIALFYKIGKVYTLQTHTRTNLSLDARTYNESLAFRLRWILEPNVDYNTTSPDDINVTIYEDNVAVYNFLIKYDPPQYDVALPSDWLDPDLESTYRPLFFILLLIIAAIVGTLWKTNDYGFHTFMIGGIALSIFLGGFTLLATTNITYYLMKALHGVIKE